MTSALTPLQYLGSIHELFVTRKMERQIRLNYLLEYEELRSKLKNSLRHIQATDYIIDTGISYSLVRNVHYKRAIHMATTKYSKCDMYVMVDQNRDINKNESDKRNVL